MTPTQILSDYLLIRSDEYRKFILIRAAQTAPQTCARPAPAPAGAAGIVDRDLQALRPAELPLRQRAGARAEAISGGQPGERAPTQRLRAQCALSEGCGAARQFSPAARSSQRDLLDQCRAPAPTRGDRIEHHGSGPDRLRLDQGGSHRRRHGGVLPCRRRSTGQCGGTQ